MIDPNATGRQLGGYKSAALRCGISLQEWIARQIGGQSRCFRCTHWKPHAEFSKDSSRTNGFASICKPCQSDASTASRYGLTIEALADLKNKPCAICERVRPIMVDHCHKSGKVRSGLCQRCNAAIGLFGDDQKLMRKAISYLEKHHG
jgi:hypothetical protein